jgi:hypothetical protein
MRNSEIELILAIEDIMKEYERHIADTHLDNIGFSWCKKKIKKESCFKNVDHAAISSRTVEKIAPCKKCIKNVLDAFGLQCFILEMDKMSNDDWIKHNIKLTK